MNKKIIRSAFSVLLSAAISASVMSPLRTFAENVIEIRVSLINNIVYTSKGSSPTEEERRDAAEALRSITQTAYDAFIMDHPKRSMWIDVNRSRIEAVSESRQEGDHHIWKVLELKHRISVLSEYSDPEALTAELDRAIKSFTPVGDTLYDKIKSIHDYVCLLTVYDASGKYAYSAYGALVDGKSVCEGYAEAFRLICERNGIECILVSGKGIVLRNTDGRLSEYSENHMWNYVRMDDGKWYAVDATWDDGRKISHEYLLVGSETVVNQVNGRRFSQNHIPSGDISGTGLFTFVLPELSEQSYEDNNRPITDTSGETSADTSAVSSETLQTAEDVMTTESSTFVTDAPEPPAAPMLAPSKKSSSSSYYFNQLNEEQKNFYNALMKVEPPSGGGQISTHETSVTETETTEPATDSAPESSDTTAPPQTKPPKPVTSEKADTDISLPVSDTVHSDAVTSGKVNPNPGSETFTVPLVSGNTSDGTTTVPPDTEPPITFRYVVHVIVIVLAIGSLFCFIAVMILKFQHREKK